MTKKVWTQLRSKPCNPFSTDLVSLVRPENTYGSPRCQGRVQVHVLLLEVLVLETKFEEKCFQYRNLKGKNTNLCTSLAPRTFTDVLETYQGHRIRRERAAVFQAKLGPNLSIIYSGSSSTIRRIILEVQLFQHGPVSDSKDTPLEFVQNTKNTSLEISASGSN